MTSGDAAPPVADTRSQELHWQSQVGCLESYALSEVQPAFHARLGLTLKPASIRREFERARRVRQQGCSNPKREFKKTTRTERTMRPTSDSTASALLTAPCYLPKVALVARNAGLVRQTRPLHDEQRPPRPPATVQKQRDVRQRLTSKMEVT